MRDSALLHDLLLHSAERTPAARAIGYGGQVLDYGTLAANVQAFASALIGLGVTRGERVGIYLEKRFEGVIASFGAPAAGTVFVPLNPLLKPDQVGYILQDCDVRVLVTSAERLTLLAEVLRDCSELRHIILVGGTRPDFKNDRITVHSWPSVMAA